MFYDFHTTKMSERVALMQRGDFVWKTIRPEDIIKVRDEADRGKSIVWEEDTGRYYEIDFTARLKTLEQYEADKNIDYRNTEYFKKWSDVKGEDYCRVRITNFLENFENIKKNGFISTENMSPCVEATGEKLDGQHRSVIAYYLGIKEIKVKEYSFNWRDVEEDFIKRKLGARWLGQGLNYYFIKYNEELQNMPEKKSVYAENSYDRWEVLKDLIVGEKVLDLGCNEGFLSIMSAKSGKKAVGVDYSFIDGANLNKLIFEFLEKRDLPVHFIEKNIVDFIPEENYDTTLLLNVIYHLSKEKQIEFLNNVRKFSKRVIMQGNLRKLKEHNKFFGITADDMENLLEKSNFKVVKKINWRDKPIVVAE